MAKDTYDVDLTSMSLDDLKKLKKDVSKAIDSYQERQRIEALAALEAKAKEMGFSLSELTGGKKKGSSKGTPKYVHPENPALTWTGRGRQPNWIKEGIASGKSLDDFLLHRR
jgi:DNA-binding protein H-NS